MTLTVNDGKATDTDDPHGHHHGRPARPGHTKLVPDTAHTDMPKITQR